MHPSAFYLSHQHHWPEIAERDECLLIMQHRCYLYWKVAPRPHVGLDETTFHLREILLLGRDQRPHQQNHRIQEEIVWRLDSLQGPRYHQLHQCLFPTIDQSFVNDALHNYSVQD